VWRLPDVGKPLGVLLGTWLPVRLGAMYPACRHGLGRRHPDWFAGRYWLYHVHLCGQPGLCRARFLLDAAKLGVLCGSLASAVLGLAWGLIVRRRYQQSASQAAYSQA